MVGRLQIGNQGSLVAVAMFGLAVAACGEGRDLSREETSFDDVFELVRQVELEQSEADPVVDITSLTPLPDGGFLLVDQPAGRIRAFDADGNRENALGGPGEGPRELQSPTSVARSPEGALYVAQRGEPRLTRFGPDGSAESIGIPGHYGHWIAHLGGQLVVGVASRQHRYAAMSLDGEVIRTFGVHRPSPSEYPSGSYLLRDNHSLAGGQVLVNTSLSPRIRVFDGTGDSLRSFGEAPASWQTPGQAPGSEPTLQDTRQTDRWLRSFTMVTHLATVEDSLVVVQYGRYDPVPDETLRVRHETADVYRLDGTRLREGLPLEEPLLAGDDRLYTIGDEPPGPWTVNVYEWRASTR